jgi:glucokinase
MKINKPITTNDLRHINRTVLLELARREGPISRTELAERLKISVPTVMRIVDDLIEEKMLKETGDKEWSGGRRRNLIEFNATEHLAIGVDMGGTKMFGALSDLNGKILKEINIPRHETKGEKSYQLLETIIRELSECAGQVGINVLGVGVGVPGTVDVEAGKVISAPVLDWLDFPLRQRLEDEFHLPTVIDNDTNLSALGELWFGTKDEVNDLVLITVGTGIGAGIIIDNSVYRGAHQAAGEIGFLLPSVNHLGKYYQSGYGALEHMASGTGIGLRARQVLAGQRSPEELEALTSEDVFEAARQREEWARKLVDETVDLLAMAVSSVILCFDPDIVVLGGGVARSADLLIEPIKQRVGTTMPFPVNLIASTLGYRAAVMGSIVNLVYHTADFYSLRKLS